MDTTIDPSMDLLGKVVGDIQENVVVGEDSITGTLKYLDDYTGFSSKAEEQSGNYIVLHADVPEMPDATIKVKVTTNVTLDEDKIAILRIADKETQTITVTASKRGYTTVTKTYSLTDLVCESAS